MDEETERNLLVDLLSIKEKYELFNFEINHSYIRYSSFDVDKKCYKIEFYINPKNPKNHDKEKM